MIRTTVDGVLESIRSIQLSPLEQAELIQRLRDGEGEEHKPDGIWVVDIPGSWSPASGRYSAEDSPFNISWVHGPKVDPDDGLEVTFYHGRDDGKPVIQIDGSADFRINVNDCPVWDQSTDQDYEMPDELKEALNR